MSRWAHEGAPAKRQRKQAAVIAPASRPATFARSAKLLFRSSAYSSPIGMRQARSTARSPAGGGAAGGARAGRGEWSGEFCSRRKESAVMRAERDDAGPGQRRDVDNGPRLEPPR